MSENYVAVPPGSTGTKMRTVENTINGNVVDQSVVTLATSDGTLIDGTTTTGLPVAGDVASLATDSGNPVKIGAVYSATLPAPASGQRVSLQADAGGRLIVGADVAAGGTDSGNPIKVGGRYNSTLPSLSNGQRGDLQLDSSARLLTVAQASTTTVTLVNAASPSASGTTAQPAVTGLGGYRTATIYANIQGGTGGTLDIYIQISPDGGTTWIDYIHFAQLAAGASAVTKIIPISKLTPTTTGITTVGTGTSPALAANTVVGGDFGDRMRVVFVAGAGTSAGATQTILMTLSS